jgi:hypothetical protein
MHYYYYYYYFFFHQCLLVILVCLYCNYLYLDCAVSVIDLLAVDSAHK